VSVDNIMCCVFQATRCTFCVPKLAVNCVWAMDMFHGYIYIYIYIIYCRTSFCFILSKVLMLLLGQCACNMCIMLCKTHHYWHTLEVFVMCIFTGTSWRTAVHILRASCSWHYIAAVSTVFTANFIPEWCQAALYLCEKHLLYWELTCCCSSCRRIGTRRILSSERVALFCLTPVCCCLQHIQLACKLDCCVCLSYFVYAMVHLVGH
jgi:hypothetical protein